MPGPVDIGRFRYFATVVDQEVVGTALRRRVRRRPRARTGSVDLGDPPAGCRSTPWPPGRPHVSVVALGQREEYVAPSAPPARTSGSVPSPRMAAPLNVSGRRSNAAVRMSKMITRGRPRRGSRPASNRRDRSHDHDLHRTLAHRLTPRPTLRRGVLQCVYGTARRWRNRRRSGFGRAGRVSAGRLLAPRPRHDRGATSVA